LIGFGGSGAVPPMCSYRTVRVHYLCDLFLPFFFWRMLETIGTLFYLWSNSFGLNSLSIRTCCQVIELRAHRESCNKVE
jgi:hypothetical protein